MMIRELVEVREIQGLYGLFRFSSLNLNFGNGLQGICLFHTGLERARDYEEAEDGQTFGQRHGD